MAGRASEWTEVDLVGQGHGRLSRVLSFAAHPMVQLSAAEHLCLTWMIRETVHAGWSQDFSLGKLTDAFTDAGPVVDGDAVAHVSSRVRFYHSIWDPSNSMVLFYSKPVFT